MIIGSLYNENDPNEQMMKININNCPTPDSSFIS